MKTLKPIIIRQEEARNLSFLMHASGSFKLGKPSWHLLIISYDSRVAEDLKNERRGELIHPLISFGKDSFLNVILCEIKKRISFIK